MVARDVEEWVKAGIIRSVRYPTWIANLVLVKKCDGDWRMCIDFKNLNSACSKDYYPLPNIDCKVESVMGFKYKSFLDAYKGYHQIQMSKKDEEKIVNLEAYVDDMVIKSNDEKMLLADAEKTFDNLRRINMKLNPKKCSFGVEEGKFLGYMVTSKGIRANPKKTRVLADLQSPRMLKEIQSLAGKLAALNRFLAKSAERKKLCSYGEVGTVTSAHDKEIEAIFRSTSSEGAYNITFEPRNAMKGQVLADFISETPNGESPENYFRSPKQIPEKNATEEWVLFTDGASSTKGSRVVLVLIGPNGIEHTYALCLTFDSTNNEAEYEALLAGLRIAREMGIQKLAVKYLAKAKEYIASFRSFSIKNIPRNQNQKADVLIKLASVAFNHLTKEVLVEVLNERSTERKEISTIVEDEGDNWMTPIIQCLEKGVMAAPIIFISSYSSEESVGSHAPRVILFGTIPAIIMVIPECSILVDYSSFSDSDPSEDSLPIAPTSEFPLAPVVSPPEIRRRPAILIRPGEAIPFGRPYRTHLNGPCKLLTARKRVGPFPARRLTWRRVPHRSSNRHSSPDFTSDSSSSSSSSDSSSDISSGSSSDSLSDSSSIHSSGCDASESSLDSSFERSLDSSLPSVEPSHKRCRSLTTLVPSSTLVPGSVAPSLADLPPRKRFRDSYSSEASGEEHIEIGTADAETVAYLGISEGVGAPIEDDIGMGVEVATSDIREDEEEFEVEASAGGTMEITIDPLATGGIFESTREDAPDLEEQLEAGQLVASREKAGLADRVRSLGRENLRVRALLCILGGDLGVDSLRCHMVLSQEEFRQIRRDRDDTQMRLRRLESLVERRLGFRR
ncbi:reverse transcriptase domain-containing protein [Tanacetum coccineum]